MDKTKCKQLLEKWRELELEAKEFIVLIIRNSEGRITIPKKSEQKWGFDASVAIRMDDDDPHVYITDVYIVVSNDVSCVKVDGIGSRGEELIGIGVEPEHYHHVLNFINNTLNPSEYEQRKI